MTNETARINSLRMLTPEEELAWCRKNFEKICEGTLFDLGRRRHFLAVKKIDDQSWEVVELDKANRLCIIKGEKVRHSVLSFDQMAGLNVREQWL